MVSAMIIQWNILGNSIFTAQQQDKILIKKPIIFDRGEITYQYQKMIDFTIYQINICAINSVAQ